MSGVRRKALAHRSVGIKQHHTPASVFNKLAGKQHLHACTDLSCRQVYVCNCKDPALNGRCGDCRGSYRLAWEKSRDPQPCCVDNCEQITDNDELLRYELAGPGPWFQCRTCARCHARPSVSPHLKGQS